MKSEPDAFSWDMQVKRGAKGEPWSGVRNHQAKLNLMRMKKGERGFFYHSGEGKEIVGIAEVTRDNYPAPPAKPGEPWVAVDVKAIAPFAKPVTLVEAKTVAGLKDMGLVNNTRPAVAPVRAE